MTLDELHEKIKKIDSLLSDRQPGLASWHRTLIDQLQELVEMCAKAGIKALTKL